MKCKLLLLLLLAGPVLQADEVESDTPLGFGFHLELIAMPSSSGFESIGHFQFLYYRDRRLAQPGAWSISPLGNFAAYEDGASGDLCLFRSAGGQVSKLAARSATPVKKIEWDEKESYVQVYYQDRQQPVKFPLK